MPNAEPILARWPGIAPPRAGLCEPIDKPPVDALSKRSQVLSDSTPGPCEQKDRTWPCRSGYDEANTCSKSGRYPDIPAGSNLPNQQFGLVKGKQSPAIGHHWDAHILIPWVVPAKPAMPATQVLIAESDSPTTDSLETGAGSQLP